MAIPFGRQSGRLGQFTAENRTTDISFSQGVGIFGKGLKKASPFVSASFNIADAITIGRIADANAAAFMRENGVATIASRERIRDVRRSFAFLQGRQVAGFGAAGVLLEGSALEVVADTAGELKRSILREEWNLKNLIALNNYRAAVVKAQAKAQRNRLFASAALNVLQGSAGAFGQ